MAVMREESLWGKKVIFVVVCGECRVCERERES